MESIISNYAYHKILNVSLKEWKGFEVPGVSEEGKYNLVEIKCFRERDGAICFLRIYKRLVIPHDQKPAF